MAIYEITVIDAPRQQMSTVLAGVAVEIELFWNETVGRWAMSISRDGIPLVQGRRLVAGVDLLRGYALGLGKLMIFDWEGKGGEPGRRELPSGQFRLLHDDGLP